MRLDGANDSLFKAIQELEQRLSPVLAPAQEGKNGTESSEIPNQISAYIDANATFVSLQVSRLNTILSRLELP